MLVIDSSVNRVVGIDTLMIQRVKSTKSGLNTYKIIEPKGFEDKSFKHNYEDGYLPLLKMVVDYLLEHNYKPTTTRLKWQDLYNEVSSSGGI